MPATPGLSAKVEEVTRAAIAAEMAEIGYYGTCDEGFVGGSRATSENDFDPFPPEIRIRYPSGEFERADGTGRPELFEPHVDADALFRKWERTIAQNFERFEETPDPARFERSIDVLADVTVGLDAGGATVVGEGAGVRVEVGNLDLSSHLDYVRSGLGQFRGEAMEVLHRSYLGRLHTVIAGQQVLAAALGVTLAGEQELWRAARTDVLQIADDARDAFEQVARGRGGDPRRTLEVFGAITSAIGLFVPKVAVARTVIGIVQTFLPDPPERAELSLGGGSTREVHTNLLHALSTLNSSISVQEQGFGSALRAVNRTVHDSLDAFDLGTPADFLAETDRSRLFAAGEDLAVTTEHLRRIAATLELVKVMISRMGGAAHRTIGESAWRRSSVAGFGRSGHFPQWSDVRDLLADVVRRTGATLGEVAGQMVLASHDFDRTEDQIAADLQELLREIPDPTPGSDIVFGHPSPQQLPGSADLGVTGAPPGVR